MRENVNTIIGMISKLVVTFIVIIFDKITVIGMIFKLAVTIIVTIL